MNRFKLAVLFLILAAAGWFTWAYFWNDFDFYRPAKPLQCKELPANVKPYRLIAFGDFGQGTPFQRQLGKVMGKTWNKTPFQAALLLGDNIYPNGDIRHLVKPNFEDPYQELIANHVRFIAAIGDHDDHHGHLQDEMAYFKMPAKYYQVSLSPDIDVFVINSTYFVRDEQQKNWISHALATSHARWKIVIGHHPLYSSGKNTLAKGLKDYLEPLMIRYHVDLYLAGHDHDYERFQPIQGVHYIVSGGGGSYLYNFRTILPQSQVHFKTHHFLLIEIAGNTINIKAINRFGDVIDCIQWQQ